MAQWYPIYDNTSKDVEGAGFFAEPESVEVPEGKTMGQGQAGDIPNDLRTEGETPTFNYTYNTETNLVEAKA